VKATIGGKLSARERTWGEKKKESRKSTVCRLVLTQNGKTKIPEKGKPSQRGVPGVNWKTWRKAKVNMTHKTWGKKNGGGVA